MKNKPMTKEELEAKIKEILSKDPCFRNVNVEVGYTVKRNGKHISHSSN